MKKLVPFVVIVVFAAMLSAPGANATSSRTLEATFTSVANGWEKVERWKDNSSSILAEAYPSDGRGNQLGQRATFFASAQPHSSRFLLYHAPNWDTGTKPTPVLLVHGANQQADFAWANPNELGGNMCGAATCPTTGLMQYLDTAGYKVFAISFPHKNGNGYYWSEQIYDAIEIIKSKTGATKVDVVAWSKGGFNARMYASSVKQSWGTAYASNIRRLALIGAPNNGYDYAFRHGTIPSLGVYSECGGGANGAVAHYWLVCYGIWYYHPEWDHGSSWYPGTKQMLKRWDGTYGLPLEQDYWTTYYGGLGYVSEGSGIDAFTPSSLVNTVRTAGIPSAIRTHLLCGNTNDIPLIHNEHTGTSDGLIFTSSCTSTVGVGTNGGGSTQSLNHNKLGWTTSAMSQIQTWLNAP
ncbi:MAG: lipase [Actinomycetota bacterium]